MAHMGADEDHSDDPPTPAPPPRKRSKTPVVDLDDHVAAQIRQLATYAAREAIEDFVEDYDQRVRSLEGTNILLFGNKSIPGHLGVMKSDITGLGESLRREIASVAHTIAQEIGTVKGTLAKVEKRQDDMEKVQTQQGGLITKIIAYGVASSAAGGALVALALKIWG